VRNKVSKSTIKYGEVTSKLSMVPIRSLCWRIWCGTLQS